MDHCDRTSPDKRQLIPAPELVRKAAACASVEEANRYLALADHLCASDTVSALALFEGLSQCRKLEPVRIAARREWLLATEPARFFHFELIQKRVQPESLGAAFVAARHVGKGRDLPRELAEALAAAPERPRLVRLLASLARGSLDARRFAGALLLAMPPQPLDASELDVLEILVLDPWPEVWSYGAAAWGRQSLGDESLAATLGAALAGRRVFRLAAPQDGAAPGPSRSRLRRRALAALGALARDAPEREVTLPVGPVSASRIFEERLLAPDADFWDQASAVYGLLAHEDLTPLAPRLDALCRRGAPQVLANLAYVIDERRPSGTEAIAESVLAHLEPPRDLEGELFYRDTLVRLQEASSGFLAELGSKQVLPRLRSYLAARACFLPAASAAAGSCAVPAAGPGAVADNGGLGVYRLLAVSEALRRLDRLQDLTPRLEQGSEKANRWADAAVEETERGLRAALVALRIDAEPAAARDALVSAYLHEASVLVEETEKHVAEPLTAGVVPKLGTRLWILWRHLRSPARLREEDLSAEEREEYLRVRPADFVARLGKWTAAALERGEGRVHRTLLVYLTRAGSARADLGNEVLKVVPAVLRAAARLDAKAAARARRELAELSAWALDFAEANGRIRADTSTHELIDVLGEHPHAGEDFLAEVDGRLRGAVSRRLLTSLRGAAAEIGRQRREVEKALRGAIDDGDRPGTIDGTFEIVHLLGRGGFGAVYRCASLRHGRDVAVKVCLDASQARGREFQRFMDEAVNIAQLGHPAIPAILALGHHHGFPYLVMELVEGRTLRERLDAGDLDEREKRRLLADLGRVLQFAHARRVVHRDLKPGNVMVTEQGELKVLDWGLAHAARVDAPGYALAGGTLLYSAPEQFDASAAEEHRVDHRVDYFAFGRVVLDALGGLDAALRRRLLESAGGNPWNLCALMDTVVTERVRDRSLAAELRALMASKPERRPETMEGILKLLE
jgi:hypothetical protein